MQHQHPCGPTACRSGPRLGLLIMLFCSIPSFYGWMLFFQWIWRLLFTR